MISKQSFAYAGIFVVCATGLIHAWILDEGQSFPIYVWLPLLLITFWAFWALRDPPDRSTKAFDFNPKRGILYFLLGLIIFPSWQL